MFFIRTVPNFRAEMPTIERQGVLEFSYFKVFIYPNPH